MVKWVIGVAICLVLVSCSSSNEPNETTTRDLADAISFDDLITSRMNNDEAMDGATVLISDQLNAYFDTNAGCANDLQDPMPCTSDIYNTGVKPRSYQGSGVGPCTGYGFELVNDQATEKVIVDLDEHTEFYMLSEENRVKANFYADIEFVERNVWCSDQVNYGLKITLKDGEEEHLLSQFIE